jgi:uroporphyrin-III C-methyltransferase/precorrin-2 dehydrogenase/sirohydrochlorin ferrochelatase
MNAIVAHSRANGAPRPARMQELARLPVFLALQGKRALVAGGSAAAAWKAELLSAAGAQVDVFAAGASEELLAIAADAPRGPVIIHPRAWMPADFAGAAIAVGAYESEGDAAHFARAARTAGVPVNVVDRPDFCDFAFGAIVNRSPLVIGISTDGAAPVFAQAIRGKLEALIPAGFACWAEAARRWRGAVKNSGLSFDARRRFWQLFTARAMALPAERPCQNDLDRFLAGIVEQACPSGGVGSITFVEASMAADLLTLRAARAMQAADVVVYDEGVAPEILDFARREAKKIAIAQNGPANDNQTDVWRSLTAAANSGKRVVYLQHGLVQPTELAAKIAACRTAGIEVRVVPAARAM